MSKTGKEMMFRRGADAVETLVSSWKRKWQPATKMIFRPLTREERGRYSTVEHFHLIWMSSLVIIRTTPYHL